MSRISRRAVLRGLGAAIALPFLESIGGAATRQWPRLCCIEIVHGSAGSTKYGIAKHLWAPAETGRNFDLSSGILSPLEAFREYVTIVSNTDIPSLDALTKEDAASAHGRSSATFLTQSRPKQTEGSDVRAGISLDQFYAQTAAQDTPIPSLQLCIENVNASNAFGFGYSNVYRDTISWATPAAPLPMVNDPRLVFDRLFGSNDTNRRVSASILDWVVSEIARLSRNLPASDRLRLDGYLTDIREVERRIQKIEELNRSGERRASPENAVGVPDDFDDHVRLMFDLQFQAFVSGITRVSAFKLGLDALTRAYPKSGVSDTFHGLSHHGEKDDKILQYAKVNKYHVSLVAYFLDKLKNATEGDGNLLDNTIVLYGSPMGDSNFHNHKSCPLVLAGRTDRGIKGNLHLRAADGTPMANVFVSLLQALGVEKVTSFGDSTGMVALG
jgi:hypothetical protein